MNALALSFSDLALWAFGSTVLVWLLVGGMNRRRQHLTELLRKHVETKIPPSGAAEEAVGSETET